MSVRQACSLMSVHCKQNMQGWPPLLAKKLHLQVMFVWGFMLAIDTGLIQKLNSY